MAEDSQPIEDNNMPPPPRMRYDEDFAVRAATFLESLVTAIPELHGAAIVPLWENPPEKMPAGIVHLRSAEPPYVHSLLALLGRLSTFAVETHRDLIGQMKILHGYKEHLEAQIQAVQQQLQQEAQETTEDNG
jgi:hypothetical protein